MTTLLDNQITVSIRHIQAVNHHQCPDPYIQTTPSQPQHFHQMRILEEQRPRELIVLFIERAACYKYADGHNCYFCKNRKGGT
jgi:hypothetical protein